MAILTVSASTFRTAYHGDSGWHSSKTHAFQGCYNNGSSRVGVMLFDDLVFPQGAKINSITFKPTIDSGTNDASRTIELWSSNLQQLDTGVLGTEYPKEQLGELTGNGVTGTGIASTYPGAQTFLLDKENNSQLFATLSEYLLEGNVCLLLFNGETTNKSGYSYSANYLAIYALTLVIDYDIVYRVTYNTNGVTQEPEQGYASAGDSVILPTLSADGYVFYGWSEDPLADSGMMGIYTPEGDVILHAVWKKLHAVSFDGNGVTEAPAAVSVEDGKHINLPNVAADSYHFLGWSENPGAEKGIIGSYTPQGDVLLYAIWKKLHKVYFDANGVVESPETAVVENGACIDLPNVAADGYRFFGWSEDPNAKCGLTGSYTPQGDVLLHAIWRKLHTVFFDGNGVGESPDPVTVEDGNAADLPKLEAKGYRFLGWSEDPDSEDGSVGNYYPMEDVTLYAIWARSGTCLKLFKDGGLKSCHIRVLKDGKLRRSGIRILSNGALIKL